MSDLSDVDTSQKIEGKAEECSECQPEITKWTDNLSLAYAEFSGNIPTDKAGYIVILKHFIGEGDRVVEIGPNVGNFARQIAKKASYVLALEPNQAAIEEGEKRNQEQSVDNVTFRKIPEIGEYETGDEGSFDVAVMCFVDPVMSTEQLENAIQESSKLLRPGGKLLIYSLNPQSILNGPESRHHYYTERVTKGDIINQGVTMTHTLNLPNGQQLPLTDVVHLDNAISNFGISNGFARAVVRVLTRNMSNGIGLTVKEAITMIEEEIGDDVLDEFGDMTGIPLYRLIELTKLDPNLIQEI